MNILLVCVLFSLSILACGGSPCEDDGKHTIVNAGKEASELFCAKKKSGCAAQIVRSQNQIDKIFWIATLQATMSSNSTQFSSNIG